MSSAAGDGSVAAAIAANRPPDRLVTPALAVLRQAAVLLLDEPAAALDFHNQAILLSML